MFPSTYNRLESERKLIIAIYSHPCYYPPTLNAIKSLAKYYKSIEIVHRNVVGFSWNFPDNVELFHNGRYYSVDQVQKSSFLFKVRSFFLFTTLLFNRIIKTKNYDLLLYDVMPCLAVRLIYKFIRKPGILWYHNHDIVLSSGRSRTSLTYWASNSEGWIFSSLNIFSLPAEERLKYFPLHSFKGKYFVVPNYPSKYYYSTSYKYRKVINKKIKILYQGSIGPNHGLEEIIPILNSEIEGHSLELVLKGFISDEYKEKLISISRMYKVEEKLEFISPVGGYQSVIDNALKCHIGVGILTGNDVNYRTAATASNKIYEYAASGLPVLLNDTPQFREILGNSSWVYFVDEGRESIMRAIRCIILDWEKYSRAAHNEFLQKFNFEKYFCPIITDYK
jgi:glycosyltransferase involved in cell wall biosynthesis